MPYLMIKVLMIPLVLNNWALMSLLSGAIYRSSKVKKLMFDIGPENVSFLPSYAFKRGKVLTVFLVLPCYKNQSVHWLSWYDLLTTWSPTQDLKYIDVLSFSFRRLLATH